MYHGDAWIVWPDPANASIKSSIREANQRDGVEEWEVFNLLKRSNPLLAQEIVANVITSSTDHSRDIPFLSSQRERLLRAAAESQ